MPSIDCRTKMTEALAAIERWSNEHAAMFAVDAAPECQPEWSRDYAIITLELDALDDSPYIDSAQALADVRQVALNVFGPKFRHEYGTKSKPSRKPGDLVCQFHLHEIEIFRVKA